MKQYYLEQANTKETQLDMARIGYAKKCHEIASKLMSCTVTESYQLIKELSEASNAYRELEDEHKYAVKRYQEVALKDVNGKEEKENA